MKVSINFYYLSSYITPYSFKIRSPLIIMNAYSDERMKTNVTGTCFPFVLEKKNTLALQRKKRKKNNRKQIRRNGTICSLPVVIKDVFV